MIETSLYRFRIGNFNLYSGKKRKSRSSTMYSQNIKKNKKSCLQKLLIFILLLATLQNSQYQRCYSRFTKHGGLLSRTGEYILQKTNMGIISEQRVFSKKMSVNFKARYKFGNPEVKRSRGIKNFHLNIRSLVNKISEVKSIAKEHNPHILGISEAELRNIGNRFDQKKLKIPGYNLLFPKSWTVHGYARVVVYVKSCLQYQQVHELEGDTVQSVWLKGGHKNSKQIYFCHSYREHTSTLGSSLQTQREYLGIFLNQWEEAIDHGHGQAGEPNEVHVMGDMNIDVLGDRWLQPDYHLVSLSRMVHSVCNAANFSQLVTAPTRAQFNTISGVTSMSCIDHIYTNYKFRCSLPACIPFGGSDHDMICYTRFSKDPPSPAKTIKKRSYKNFVKGDFLADLQKVDWTDVYIAKDVDDALDRFTFKFRTVLNLHAPWITFQQRKKFVPWLTDDTKNLMKERDDLKAAAMNLAKEGKETREVWDQFKKVRNKVNNRRKFEERTFKAEKIKESQGCPSTTWKTTKSFMEWERDSGPPSQLNINGDLITKASLIASIMNNFFVNKVRLIRQGISYLPNSFTTCLSIMKNKHCKLSLQHVSTSKVNKLLKNLKNSRSCSIDELDNFSVKLAADVIAEPVHHIVVLSILQQKFPTSWKYSKVIPLHKKNSKLECKNYRPVTILSPLSKILEKIAYEQLYEYFSRNKIFNSNLHGYRQHRSTQTALLSMYDRWVSAASQGQVSGVLLLDLSAAFDLVEPDLLLRKLEIYGVDSDFLCWIRSYLTCRHQAVWIDHVLSDFVSTDIGVPQGSNLGPLFFLIFFNDLPESLGCEVDSYADDTTLTKTEKTVEEIGNQLTENCRGVSTWMRANRLKLNPEKTHILTVGTQERLNTLPHPVYTTMDGVQLQEEAGGCELLLGCQMQANMKWHSQVNNLLKKLRTRLTGLMHIKYILPYQTRKTVTEGIFNSVLVYCLPLFGGCDVGQVRDMQVLQNKAARIVCLAPPRANRVSMFKKLSWMTVNQLISYHSLLTVFKMRTSGEPEYLARKLKYENRLGKIIIPNTNLSLAKKSFIFRASQQWNALPESMRKTCKIGNFKTELRKFVFSSIPDFIE